MTEEQKMFEVDYSKLNFRIGIDVCENGSTLYVFDVKEGYAITYHTLIGVLETLKANFIQQQSMKNRESETVNPDLKEAQKSFEQAHKQFKYPNDCLVCKSGLSNRIKNSISEYCLDGRYLDSSKSILSTIKFSDLMLSDLSKVAKWEYLRIRNFGHTSYTELKNYLVSLGFEMKN